MARATVRKAEGAKEHARLLAYAKKSHRCACTICLKKYKKAGH